MKYYVRTKQRTENGDLKITTFGDIIKRGVRANVCALNNTFESAEELDEQNKRAYDDAMNLLVEKVFNNPIKTLQAANRLKNKLGDTAKVIDYPDEISFDQFKAFIAW